MRCIVLVLSWSVTSGLRLVDFDDATNIPETDMTKKSTSPETMAFDGQNWFFQGVKDVPMKSGVDFANKRKTSNCALPEGHKFFSQSGEDLDLYNAFFCNRTGGTFVELGALDGVKFSNTKFFEDSLGWSGVLIEGNPHSAELVKQNRPNSKNSIFAEGVCPAGQSSMKFVVGGQPETSGNPDTMSDQFKDHWHAGPRRGHTIEVPCRSLDVQLKEYIQRSGADHIDFFSLDVEGGELAVLQTFSFEVPVHCWIVELDGSDPEKDEGVRKIFRERKYVKSSKSFNSRNEVWVIPSLEANDQ